MLLLLLYDGKTIFIQNKFEEKESSTYYRVLFRRNVRSTKNMGKRKKNSLRDGKMHLQFFKQHGYRAFFILRPFLDKKKQLLLAKNESFLSAKDKHRVVTTYVLFRTPNRIKWYFSVFWAIQEYITWGALFEFM
jgi:hypothetical protein